MCGIVGIAGPSLGAEAERQVFRASAMLAHRGPDGSDIFADRRGRAVFGHRRLAIIDTGPGGRQPMASACGRYVIVFNGEIYNYRELRADLEKTGERFATQSDTEVLLRAFMRRGPEALGDLNGMFAFAIFDRGADGMGPRLFLARDRVGEKPLYLCRDGASLSFASELKALPGRGTEIDPQALDHYLALGYVPGSMCLVRGAEKLPPGHCAEFDPETGAFRRWAWWSLPSRHSAPTPPADELEARVLERLEAAVAIRLRADVPVGILLSGGLDSSILASLAARAGASLEAFTISAPGTPLDEAPRAARLAEALGLRHHVLPLAAPRLDTIAEFAAALDEPIGDSSLIPALMVAQMAARHVKVAIGGDGGDEVFGGYEHYLRTRRDAERLHAVPTWAWSATARLASRLPLGYRGRNRLMSLRDGPASAGVWGTSFFDPASRARLTGAPAGPCQAVPENWRRRLSDGETDPVEGEMRRDFHSTLPDDYLVKIDRASMRFGLELRAPYLDHTLVELAYSHVPPALKVSPVQTRILQRRLAARILPPHIEPSRKQGFSVPLDSWLRASRAREFEALIGHLPAPIDRNLAHGLIDGLMRGRANGARIFCLMMLALGCRNLGLAG